MVLLIGEQSAELIVDGMETADAPVHERPCRSKIADIAPVGELASRCADFSAMSAQTCDWSDVCAPLLLIDAVTCVIRFARPLEYCARGADANPFNRARQRPASTHDTGMFSATPAGTRMVRLTTRFCFAPTSSSPSTISVGTRPRLTARSSGTLPCSDTSVISKPAAEGLVQRLVVGDPAFGRFTPNQREHDDVLEREGGGEGDGRQRLGDG